MLQRIHNTPILAGLLVLVLLTAFAGSGLACSGPVDLNAGTQADLERVNGIGKKKLVKIVAWLDDHRK
ncbi:MAG: hypothetical protein OXB94_06785 [Nitrospira sp.]|nr:hypothetical protein [Nitrospira sp.]